MKKIYIGILINSGMMILCTLIITIVWFVTIKSPLAFLFFLLVFFLYFTNFVTTPLNVLLIAVFTFKLIKSKKRDIKSTLFGLINLLITIGYISFYLFFLKSVVAIMIRG